MRGHWTLYGWGAVALLGLGVTLAASDVRANVEQVSNIRLTSFKGKVNFEKRSTLVPMMVCNGKPCVPSQPYWSMVIISDDVRYELNKPFAMGSHRAPESVEVGRVLIRPGSQVAIEGIVDPISSDYAIVSEVKWIQILMDSARGIRNDPGAIVAESEPDSSYPQYFGWMCESVRSNLPQLYVTVVFSGESRSGGLYRMRVDAKTSDNTGSRMLALADSATARTFGGEMVYEGTGENTKVELHIEPVEGRDTDFPSRVILSQMYSVNDVATPIETELLCARTRALGRIPD